MSTRLIIEGNSVYEIDEDCLECSRSNGTDAGQSRLRDKAGRRTPDAPDRIVRGLSERQKKPGNLPQR